MEYKRDLDKMTEKDFFIFADRSLEEKLEVIEVYGNKILAKVKPSQYYELLEQGYKIKNLSSKTKIRIGSLSIDPNIPEEREKIIDPTKEKEILKTEYFFIQFIGPAKPEWLKELKESKLRTLSYYHDFTYLVQAKRIDVEKITEKRYVRATLPYAPSLKLSEELKYKIKQAKDETPIKFIVHLCTARNTVNETLKEIEDLGVKLEGKLIGKGIFISILVSMPFQLVLKISNLIDVFQIEIFVEDRDMDEIADQIIAGNPLDAPLPGHHPYLEWLKNLGINGGPITIGIVELSGRIDEDHEAFDGRINTITTEDKNYHATMVGGQAAGDYRDEEDVDGFIYVLGVATGAHLINQNYHDHGDPIDPDLVCNDTIDNGGTVQNNSWGSIVAMLDYKERMAKYDRLVRDADGNNSALTICFSAGNLGTNGLGRPASAKNIITVGNFENLRNNLFGCGDLDADNIDERYIRACADSDTGASSTGECEDGRVKPDIVAPGQWTASANSSVGGKDNTSPRFISNKCVYGGGTSASSPKVAGACTLIIQWWRQRHTWDNTEISPSPALNKALIINGAVDTGEGGHIPNEEQGWGRINLNNIFNSEIAAIYVDQDFLLQSVSNDIEFDIEFDIEPIFTDQPMKITLVWTDLPGAFPSGTAGNPALINALDIEVTQGVNTWFGNNFVGGTSQTGGVQDAIQNVNPGDIVNNVQNIFIENPLGGYNVRISPETISGNCLDPANPTTIPFQQDFALVITNAKLKTSEPLDIMLTIDRTGSMSGDRIAAAIASGQLFFDLIPTGANHKAGLVSFAAPNCLPNTPLDDKATVDIELDDVTDTLKTNAQNLIGNIVASGLTSIGTGLIKSMQQIIKNGAPLHRKVIILLSDGKENCQPFVSEILPLLYKEYRVHTVGLGGSINSSLMQKISDDTHGTFSHTLNPDDLSPLFIEIFALENDEDVVDSQNGSFPADNDMDMDTDIDTEKDIQEKSFYIINSDKRATFILSWKNPVISLNFNLLSPNGELINPDKALSSSNMTYVKRDTHVIYTVQKPVGSTPDWEGQWTMKINRDNDNVNISENYSASLMVSSSLKLKLLWNKIKFFTRDLIRLKAQIIDTQCVLKNGIKMTIMITTPLKGYGTILSSKLDEKITKNIEDTVKGTLTALDRLSETNWREIYKVQEKVSSTSFEVKIEDAPVEPSILIPTTPYNATLKKLLKFKMDGIYTFRIKIEGFTESGAPFTRVRTVSKYVEAKTDANKSEIDVFPPIKSDKMNILKFKLIPRDVHGNLIGPGRTDSISLKIEKEIIKGEIKDLLDGTYEIKIETSKRPEDILISINVDDVSIPFHNRFGKR